MSVYKEEYFGIARKIVSNMTTESWTEIPHATVGYDADVTKLISEMKRVNERSEEKITLNTVMLKIICEGLKAAPKMNCTLDFNKDLVRGTLKYHDNIDISMPAVLSSGEMMTLTLHNMETKSLSEMAKTISDTMRRSNNSNMNEVMYEVSLDNTLNALKKGKFSQTINRLLGSKMPGKHQVHNLSGEEKKEYYSVSENDRLTKHDIEQGTTTVSNLGSVCRDYSGNCYLLEIIPPQITAFALSAVQKKPVVFTDEDSNDEIQVRQIMPITIAIDHRALDYGDCVPLIKRFNEIFENPSVIQNWT